jgi:hypothetical protein
MCETTSSYISLVLLGMGWREWLYSNQVVRVDRVKKGLEELPEPEQGGLKIPSLLNERQRVGISSLRVLSSLWCLLLL